MPRAERTPLHTYWNSNALILAVVCTLTLGCRTTSKTAQPAITFTRVPLADAGGGGFNDIIEGKVSAVTPGQRIVLYAKRGVWWLQPLPEQPYTKVQTGLQWINSTHLGTDYAALLVAPEYRPSVSLDTLPPAGGLIASVASVKGQATSPSVIVPFSGYQWRVRNAPSRRGGTMNDYVPSNVWTDPHGALHLRIANASGKWSCAEVALTSSLGYGTYSFTVRDVSHLEPAAVFGMFTWDYSGSDQNFREVSVEISRWGDASSKNGQYVIQPFHVPANVARFSAPAGPLTHSFTWEPGRMTFKTVRGRSPAVGSAVVSQHIFSSGVPAPGIESVRMNLYVYDAGTARLKEPAEVVVEKFEYLP
ncbi:MAG: hypothetical protein ABI693_20640 [Bryobacteraceae bacterium]